MLKRLMIRTWRGPLPPWTAQFRSTVSRLSASGWDFVIIDDWESVRARIQSKLGIVIPEQIDTRKPGDYDPALGELYPDLLSGYDFWGHFNLDCVYGRLSYWLPDNFLENIDVYGNDPGAVCGPFTIYRNTPKINSLFRSVPENVYDPNTWQGNFESPTFYGWDEGHFSQHVRNSALHGEIRFASGFLQAHDHMTKRHSVKAYAHKSNPDGSDWPCVIDPPVSLSSDGTLIDRVTNDEIMMYHFNQTRTWPLAHHAS